MWKILLELLPFVVLILFLGWVVNYLTKKQPKEDDSTSTFSNLEELDVKVDETMSVYNETKKK